MAYADLRDFIRALEKNDELKRVSFEVDPHLEITAFADRSVKHGGPALLFEKPKGANIPVLINAFASRKRMQIALEVDSVDEIAARITAIPANEDARRHDGQIKNAADARRDRRDLSRRLSRADPARK